MLPEVAVIVPTYNRGELLKENLWHLSQNLRYEGHVVVVIGDDSDQDELAFNPLTADCRFQMSYQRNSPRLGLGANLNDLLRRCGCDIVLQGDDDHRLLKPLDITPHVRKLVEDPNAGWVRLMGVGGHRLSASLDETYWKVDWYSSELYITSNRMHLKRWKDWPLYPEGLKLGHTEESYCHINIDVARLKLSKGIKPLDVLIPLQQLEDAWTETGHSWQMEGH